MAETNAVARFIRTPQTWVAQIATANTNLDGTGTIGTIVTAASTSPGIRIDRAIITSTVTTTAGMIRFFLHDGSNYRLYKETSVTAITPSGTVKAFTATVTFSDVANETVFVIPPGWSLRASTHNAETFNIAVDGGEF